MVGKGKYLLAILCTMMPFFNAINAQDALTAVYWDATNESQCEDGVIDLHINGGFPPYDVHWTGSWGLDQGVYGITGNSGEEDLQNLRPGTYNVTVTDALCGTAQLSVQVGCSDCPELIAGIQHHGFIECEGKKGMLTVIVDDIGLPPYNIKWSNGDTTYTIFNLNEGIYSVEVTDSRGCTSSLGINLFVSSPPNELAQEVDFTVVDNCNTTLPDGSIMFNESFGSGYQYSWKGPNGYYSSSQDIDDLPAGEYCVEVRETNALECVYARGCVVVEASSYPTIQLEEIKNIPLCKGDESQWPCSGSIKINVSSGATIEWQNLTNDYELHNTQITDLCTGTYTVEVCLGECCSTRSFMIQCCLALAADGPNYDYFDPISISGQANSDDGSISLSVNGGGTPIYYEWTGPNGFTSSNKNLHNLDPGIYCVRVFDGCSKDEECFEIVDCDLVTININGNVNKTCEGYCYGSISVSSSGGNSPYQYIWDDGKSGSTISNLCSGQYCVTVTDKSGCENRKCFIVGTKDEDVSGVTNPCGWQYSCNGNPTNYIPYDGDMNCFYNDPFDCTRVNCYCPVTGGYVGGWNENYSFYNYDWASCIIRGWCPDGSGWDVAQYGSVRSWYQYVQVCDNCWQCYYIKACYMGDTYVILEAYDVGDSYCGGGPRINGVDDDDKLYLNSPIRLNELNYLLKRDSLIDEHSLLLIPEGLSDTLFLEDYTDEFAKIKDKGEQIIKVKVLPLEDEIKEIDCRLKDCRSTTDGDGSKSRSIESEGTGLIESKVLPNPFNDQVIIYISNNDYEEMTIDVTSVLGQSMINKSFSQNSLQIETNQWNSGVYICVIRIDGEIIGTHKIIKQ